MLAEIQVLPKPLGTETDRYANVRAAIAIIEASGLTYEVGALGTVVQGSPDQVWPLLRAVHEACLSAGATSVFTNLKVSEATGDSGPTIDDLVGKYRR